jgi:hypothetical protein
MAFRVRNTKNTDENKYTQNTNNDTDIKEFQIELNNLSESDKYIPKEINSYIINENIVSKNINKQNLTIEKESIIYDKNISKWIIVKESDLYKYD